MMRILSKTSLCSSIALATALVAGAKPAAAQVAGSLNNAGGATISPDGSTIGLNGLKTTIDWTASGTVTSNVNNFLPAGNSMAFSSASDFAVLNRVTTPGTQLLGLNGNISSTVNGVKGGHVFFYNSNGIVVGGTANIDVGSLGLTTAPVNGAGTTAWFSGFNAASPTLTFNQAAAGSEIRIESGANIASNGTNSYVALVAPKISHSGTIKSDGDVALVAAEAATLSFNDQYDLYGIQVDIGTSVNDSLTVDGGAIKRNSAVETAGIGRNAYLVTVAKNDATTLLITGGANIGFDVANSAVVEGNSVVLSSGRDLALFDGGASGGTIHIEDAILSSAVDAFATDVFLVDPTAGDADFLSSLEVTAGSLVNLDASAANIGIGFFLSADVSNSAASGINSVGGTISLNAAAGHNISIAGSATLNASAEGGFAVDNGFDGGTAQGGTVAITADGATVQAATFDIDVSAVGGGTYGEGAGGAAYGGEASLTASNNGSIVASGLSIDATGEGGTTSECTSCSVTGGYGEGGVISLSLSDSSLLLAPSSFNEIYAFGQGGAGDVAGGVGQGGTVNLTLSGESALVMGNGYIFADGVGGTGLQDGVGGAGFGGTATYNSTSGGGTGPTAAFKEFDLTVDGIGGNAQGAGGGGLGQGGTFDFAMDGGSLTARSILFGGIGRGGASSGGSAGEAFGSDTSVTLTGDGSISTQGVMYVRSDAIQPSAQSGDPLNGALARGGTTQLTVDQGQITTNTGGLANGGSLFVSAGATAANGAGGAGGVAIGGDVIVSLTGATITGGPVSFDARATGGAGADGSGGDAFGGSVAVTMNGSSISAPSVTLKGAATGGSGTSSGGVAHSATLALDMTDSSIGVSGKLSLANLATGGAGTQGGASGGQADSGDASITLNGSSITANKVEIITEALGGAASFDASGGAANGGTATLALNGNSSVTAPTLHLYADATGGGTGCVECSVAGGGGHGGDAIVSLNGAANALTAATEFWLWASGMGGAGDLGGGDGTASTAAMYLSAGSAVSVGNSYIFADGVGGDGSGNGNGGAGYAGTAVVSGSGSITQSGSALYHITAEGYGGQATGGDGGYAQGGTAELIGDDLDLTSTNSGLWITAFALGGNSESGGGGNASGGTAHATIGAGSVFNVAKDVSLLTYSTGGNGYNGGNATQGHANLDVRGTLNSGTALTSDVRSIALISSATGGSGSDGSGGSATGGDAVLNVRTGGTVTATGIDQKGWAVGGDGYGADATGGDADAGVSFMGVEAGGSVTTSGALFFDGSAVAGNGAGGADGGDALASGMAVTDIAGTLHVGGNLDFVVDRTGGSGRNGGDALAGFDANAGVPRGEVTTVAELFAKGGLIQVDGVTTLTANAIGGDGSTGGRGGDAYGGIVSIYAPNRAGSASRVMLGETDLQAHAEGGRGGAGYEADGGDGGNGGDGGDALGGVIYAQSNSLNGQITTGALTMDTHAVGGDGGDGGSGDNGGDGGHGGNVFNSLVGGAVYLGAVSGVNVAGQTQTDGFTHFGDITIITSATGGDGGWGGYGYNGALGLGGDGGMAKSGDTYILNRGGDFTAASITGNFDAFGGAGGALAVETASGTGGDAIIGGLTFANTNRFLEPSNRGTLTVGDVDFSGTSQGGYGLVIGGSYHLTGIDLENVYSDATIGSFSFAAYAADGSSDLAPAFTSLLVTQNGDVTVSGPLSIVTPGPLAVWTDTGTISTPAMTLDAGNFVARGGAAPAALGLLDVGSLSVSTGGDIIIQANIDSGSPLNLYAPGSIAVGSLDVGTGAIELTADGDFILTDDLTAANNIWITATGSVGTHALSSGNHVYIDASDILIDGATDASGNVTLTAPGSVGAGDIHAGGAIDIYGTPVTAGSLLADGGRVYIVGGGDVTIGGASAASNLFVAASGALSVAGDLSSSDDTELSGNGISIGGSINAGTTARLTSYQAINAGNISSYYDMTLSAATNLTAGALYSDFGNIDAFAGQSLSIASGDAGFDLLLEAANGSLTIADYSQAYGEIDLTAANFVQTADLAAVGGITVEGGAIDVGNLEAGADLSGGIGTFGFGTGEDIGLWSASTVDALSLTATGSIGIAAPGAISVGAIDAGQLVMLLGGANIATGGISAGDALYIGGFDLFALGYDALTGDFDPTPILAQFPTSTGGNVTIAGAIDATQVRASAGGGFSAGNVTASDDIIGIVANGNVALGNLSAGTQITAYSTNGSLTAGNASAPLTLDLAAEGGTLTVGTTQSGIVLLNGRDGVTAGAAQATDGFATILSDAGAIAIAGASATDFVRIHAAGAINASGALTAGTDLDVVSGGAATFTTASAGYDAWIAGLSGISGQSLTADGYALLMSDGAISAATVAATGDAGHVGIGGFGMYDAGNVDGFLPNFAYQSTQSEAPSGAATIGSISAASTSIHSSAITLNALTGVDATLTSTGLTRATGSWNTSYLDVRSGDIDIANGAAINADEVSLLSTNGVGAGIGDNSGVAQGGYLLSNAEFNRIAANHLVVLAQMNASPIDLRIGTLTLAGGENYYDLGVVDGNENYAGRLRVVGKITGQNFSDDDRLDLDAELMEIDAVNGGIDFSPNSDATVGTLAFFGQRVHVAEAAVLDELAADTQYSGRDLDLATAPTATHSDTVINVGTIDLDLFQPGFSQGGFAVGQAAAAPYSIYVQNMGTSGARSGLLIADANLYGDIAPGSVEMIINGKLVDPQTGQTLSGSAARDAFVSDPETDLTVFTASSSINGCSLTGNSCFTPPPPPPPPPPPTGDLASQIVILDTSIGDQLGFGDDANNGDSDSDEDQDEKKAEKKNAIDAPPTIINGRPLDPQTPTDEPVSGSGNPALIGTGANQQEQN